MCGVCPPNSGGLSQLLRAALGLGTLAFHSLEPPLLGDLLALARFAFLVASFDHQKLYCELFEILENLPV